MAHTVGQQANTVKPSPQLNPQRVEVVKVGEYQYQAKAELDSEAIAKIQSHNLAGHPAATVYLRNIPVLTFVESSSGASKSNGASGYSTRPASGGVKVAAIQDRTERKQGQSSTEAAADPVWRATAIAAKLNQLFRDSVDANAITVRWEKGDRYIINVKGEDLVEINTQTILPDTTKTLAPMLSKPQIDCADSSVMLLPLKKLRVNLSQYRE